MIDLPGFQILETIQQNQTTSIYKAVRLEDGLKVIIKTSSSEKPTLATLARLQREYQILRQLNAVPNIIHAYDLIKYKNNFYLVLEDIGGISLREYLFHEQKKLSLEKFFEIALKIINALSLIHQKGVIHKDINPDNILVTPDLDLRIIDFNIAGDLGSTANEEMVPTTLEATFQYMSPEQSGRMNRKVDYRSDIYSLGITFYEILTKKIPIEGRDVLEFVHQHIAKIIPLASDVNPEIPLVVAQIIAKMIAKNPEERYHSMEGLKSDILECQRQWQEQHKIIPFKLGCNDFNAKLLISQKLYGREVETEELLKAFAEVKMGAKECFFVSGFSGIGKTALVNEIQKPISYQGYFISGKFELLGQNTPYNGLIKAFDQLIKQLLTEPESKLKKIKQDLLSALGVNAQVMIGILPNLGLILGKQNHLTEIHPREAQNRLRLTFQHFVQVFAQPQHPLVIFLDDLQWADAASFQLLQAILFESSVHNLLVIGSYRDNEVNPDHHIFHFIDTLEKENIKVRQIKLLPLEQKDLDQLLMDTLQCKRNDIANLSQLLLRQTGGNPFFINAFLKVLYDKRLLKFSVSEKKWVWDINLIKAEGFTDNVIDLMANEIEELTEECRLILKLASCIGNTFDFNTLLTISEMSPENVVYALEEAIFHELILPIGNAYQQLSMITNKNFRIFKTDIGQTKYRFLHDKILQSAYELISDNDRKFLHLKIGRLLGENLTENDEQLFMVVSQFNHSLDLIVQSDEKIKVATYNLWAGNKAKVSTAFDVAKNYYHAGIKILGEQWDAQYQLLFSLYQGLSECEFLTGNYDEAEEHFDLLLRYAKTVIEKVTVNNIRIILYTIFNRYEDVLNISIKSLGLLGIHIPRKPSYLSPLIMMWKIKRKIGRRKVEDLDLFIRETKDLFQQMIDQVIMNGGVAAYSADPLVFVMLITTAVLRALENGFSRYSSIFFAAYSALLIAGFHRFKSGLTYAELSRKLEIKFGDESIKNNNQAIIHGSITHWKSPISTYVNSLNETYQSILNSGDLLFAAYNRMAYIDKIEMIARPLEELISEQKKLISFLEKTKNYDIYTLVDFHLHHALFLQENAAVTEEVLEEKFRNVPASAQVILMYVATLQGFRHYLFADYGEALALLTVAFRLRHFSPATLINVQATTFYALALAANYSQVGFFTKLRWWFKLRSLRRQLRIWANQCPENFLFRYLLLSAEMERIRGNILLTTELYDRAIEEAEKNEFVQFVGIANERAASFYLQLKKEKLAKTYLLDAHYAYSRWGAKRKVAQLEKKYPQLILTAKTQSLTGMRSSSGSESVANIDLLSILKATQVISGEIELGGLIQRMMQILLENAGGQRNLLLTHPAKGWILLAEGTVDKGANLLQVPIEGRKDMPHSIISFVQRTRENVVLDDPVHEGNFISDPYIQLHQPKSILCMPIIHHGQLSAILYVENTLSTHAFTKRHIQVLNMLCTNAATALENSQLFEAGKRFVPYQFLQQLEKPNLTEVELGDHVEKELSILFCDIQGFTKFSEQLSPAGVYQFINEFMSHMEPVVSRHRGFIDKYIGDAVMALFENADDAVQAGIEMLKQLDEFNQIRISKNLPTVKVGIGINTGKLMMGIIGARQRIESSVIGDAANVASRVEHLTRVFSVPMIISNETKAKLKKLGYYNLRPIGKEKIRGRSEPVELWEVFNTDSSQEKEIKLALLREFTLGLENYQDKNFQQSEKFFNECLAQNPSDQVALLYIERCQNRLGKDWGQA